MIFLLKENINITIRKKITDSTYFNWSTNSEYFKFLPKRPLKQKTIAFRAFTFVSGKTSKEKEKGNSHQTEPLFSSVYFASFFKVSRC